MVSSICTPFKLQTLMVILFSSILAACGGGSGGEIFSNQADTGISTPVSVIPAPTFENHPPIVGEVQINGTPRVGEKLTLSYIFEDSDGDLEGNSTVAWTTPTKKLDRENNKSFVIPNGLEGETISVWFYPVDEHGAKGPAVKAENEIFVQASNIEPTPTNTSTFAVTNSSTTPYEDLLEHRSGFAKGVTGGAGGDVVIITDLTDNSLGDALRSPDPIWIRFAPGLTGTWRYPGERVFISSNKTIDGRGADITFSYKRLTGTPNKDLTFRYNDNLIIHNITFKDIGLKIAPEAGGSNSAYGVGLHLVESTNVWIDHCTFSRIWDDALSLYDSEVTLSWSRFEDQNKNIISQGLGNAPSKLTMHNNIFDGATVVSWSDAISGVTGHLQRTPLFRNGQLHSYNNYINRWGSTGASARAEGEAIYENNIFGISKKQRPAIRSMDGYVCQHGNTLEDTRVPMTGVWDGTRPEAQAFDCSKVFAVQYQYDLDPATNALKEKIQSQAGRSDNPQW